MKWMHRGTVAVLFSALMLGAAHAQLKRADCDRAYKPQEGQTGKDVVWMPTPDGLVTRMLNLAGVKADDYVVDLGAGDGKIAIAAARDFGAQSLGIEFNANLAKYARCLVEAEAVADKVRIVQGDIFKEDFSKATVITMYLLPELNLCVRHRIASMAPGTRVVSHQFKMGDWQPDQTVEVEYRTAFFWIVPAQVEGTWSLKVPGEPPALVTLTQRFQQIGGEVRIKGKSEPLVDAKLRGDQIQFSYVDHHQVKRTFSGRVQNTSWTGSVRAASGGEVSATASTHAVKPGTWTQRLANCERFYSGK